MAHEISFYPLLIVILLAFLTPVLLSRLRRIRIPVVVGEIVAGMIFGQSGLGIIKPDPWLELLSTLGFAFLMFLSGLEIDISALGTAGPTTAGPRWKRLLAIPAVAGTLMFALTLTIAAAAGAGLTIAGLTNDPWIMGLILSTTSLGIVVPVLKERNLLVQPYGQAILVAALIADFVTMLAISVYVVLRTSGLSPDVLLVLVLLGVGLAVYQVAGVVRHRPSAKWITGLASATSQVPTRGALTLALMFIALAESLGVETILGAFIAGAIVALLAGGHSVDLVHKLDTLGYAFFVPIFFINVGATFDLPALLEQRSALLLVPLLLVIAYLVKIVPGMVFSVAFGKRAAFALGLLTSSRLSLVIAASAIGLQIGAITSATNAAIILVAIVTCTVSPLLFSRFAPIKSEERDGVLIVGESTMALLLVQRLRSQGIHTEHISASTLEAANRELSAFGGDTVAALAALTSDDEYNLQVCQAAQSHGIPSIVAQVQSVQYNELFHAAGARPINPVLATASVFEGLLTHPSVLELLTDHDDHVIMSEIVLTNPSLNGKPLREIYLPQDTLIVMISRGEDRVIARGNTRVAAGDVLTVAGSAAGLEQTQRMLQT